MRLLHRQVQGRATRPGPSFSHVGGVLICAMLFSPLAIAQPLGMSTTLDKVRVVSMETHQFSLTTSTDKKVINVPTQPEGRTVSGEILCNMQTQATLNNWYPFRYYLYKQVGAQLSLINGGGLSTNKHTYAYTVTQYDDSSNAKYVFSAHLNHAQVTGQCTLTIKITEVVPHVAPQPIQQPPVPLSPKLQPAPRKLAPQSPSVQSMPKPAVPQTQKLQPMPKPPVPVSPQLQMSPRTSGE